MDYKTSSPENTRIGWVGTGVMGLSMCRNLMEAGYKTTIFSRTKSKAQPLLDAGAVWADTPEEVAAASDVSVAIVAMPEDVESVFLGESGLLAGASAGNVLVDMTTSKPELAVRIHAAAAEKSVASIDAPVSGGDVGAKNGSLSIMIGGDQGAVAAVRPLFEIVGKTVVHQGAAGSGQHTKMVNQILVGAGMIGVCESMLYALKSGLDLETVLKSVSSGAAGSWALSNLGPRIIEGNFDPGFFVEHFVKDLNIAFEESNRMGLKLRGLGLVRELYVELQDSGFGKLGTQALQKSLAKNSDCEWPS